MKAVKITEDDFNQYLNLDDTVKTKLVNILLSSAPVEVFKEELSRSNLPTGTVMHTLLKALQKSKEPIKEELPVEEDIVVKKILALEANRKGSSKVLSVTDFRKENAIVHLYAADLDSLTEFEVNAIIRNNVICKRSYLPIPIKLETFPYYSQIEVLGYLKGKLSLN